MSFIRMGQEGSYVDIPGGSSYYLYDNGNDIEGWSHEEFAALIAGVLDEIEWGASGEEYGGAVGRIKFGFAEHFGGLDEDYRGGITPPERAEIFCQCVDRRIEGIELTEDLHDAVKEWANSFDALKECKHCGKEFRPTIYDGEPYICNDNECSRKQEASRHNVGLDIIEREDRIFNHLHYDYDYSLKEASDAATEYLLEQRFESLDEEAEQLLEEMKDE